MLGYRFAAERHKEVFMKNDIRFAVTYAFILFIGFSIAFANDEPLAKPTRNRALYAKVPAEYNKMIVNVIKESHSTIHDYNNDGKVNCIDYSIAFKLCWDRNYPSKKMNCHIIRNLNNNNGIHHLYIIVYDDSFIGHYVEPWCNNPACYSIESNWNPGSINHNYDIHNETSYWLKKAGIAL